MESLSAKAFAIADDLKKQLSSSDADFDDKMEKQSALAISTLSKLKGIGPATASACMAIYCPEVFPFMCDEVLYWACNPPYRYTPKEYAICTRVTRDKVLELRRDTAEQKESEMDAEDITPQFVSQCLWCTRHLDDEGNVKAVTKKGAKGRTKSKSPAPKRKAAAAASKKARSSKKTKTESGSDSD